MAVGHDLSFLKKEILDSSKVHDVFFFFKHMYIMHSFWFVCCHVNVSEGMLDKSLDSWQVK